MKTDNELRILLRQFIGKQKPTLLGTVKDVDKTACTCTITDDGTDYPGVRLRAVTGDAQGMVWYPSEGAFALAVQVEDTEEWAVLFATSYSSVEISAEQITFNGGKLGGLVVIGELTDKLNELVDKFNNHTHDVTVIQSPGPPPVTLPGTASQTGVPAQPFRVSDYENEAIKH